MISPIAIGYTLVKAAPAEGMEVKAGIPEYLGGRPSRFYQRHCILLVWCIKWLVAGYKAIGTAGFMSLQSDIVVHCSTITMTTMMKLFYFTYNSISFLLH